MNITVDIVKSLPHRAEITVEAASESMFPSIKKGDKIVIKIIKFSEVRVGDIIALHLADKRNIIVHRVIKIAQNSQGRGKKYIITKGDNNNSEDSWIVEKKNFLGRVLIHKV